MYLYTAAEPTANIWFQNLTDIRYKRSLWTTFWKSQKSISIWVLVWGFNFRLAPTMSNPYLHCSSGVQRLSIYTTRREAPSCFWSSDIPVPCTEISDPDACRLRVRILLRLSVLTQKLDLLFKIQNRFRLLVPIRKTCRIIFRSLWTNFVKFVSKFWF